VSRIKTAIEECYSCEGRREVYDSGEERLIDCPVCGGSGFTYIEPALKLKKCVKRSASHSASQTVKYSDGLYD